MRPLKTYLDLVVHPILALWLFFGFILFTIIGTLSHELGHIAFAKAQGCTTTLHYGSMSFKRGAVPEDIVDLAKRYKREISDGKDFPGKSRWEAVREERQKLSFWVTFGGPFQTILFGTIGFMVLFSRRHTIDKDGMAIQDWFWMFLSFFWLRMLYNPVYSFLSGLTRADFYPFDGHSDELNLARRLGWWEGSISLSLALMSCTLVVFVIFSIIPKTYRLTLLSSGLTGGLIGAWFWLSWIGPKILP